MSTSSNDFPEYHAPGTPDAPAPAQKASLGLWLLLIASLLTAAVFWFARERPGALTEPTATQEAPAVEAPVATVDEAATADQTAAASKPAADTAKRGPQRAARISREPRPLAGNAVPEYPPAALRSGVGGTVVVRAEIDANGKPADVSIAKRSGNRDLDRAALRAVRQWRFQPAMQNGKATASVVRIPVDFKPI